jgi:hypothetical protein
VPETELYELLQIQRRRLVTWLKAARQATLDDVMQTALQVSTSSTGSLSASDDQLDDANRWARIAGARSGGRYAVGSTRAVTGGAEAAAAEGEGGGAAARGAAGEGKRGGAAPTSTSTSASTSGSPRGAAGGGGSSPPKLKRADSADSRVGEVVDTGQLGVEIDVQISQMTLRSKHLSALETEVANHQDVIEVFGDATMQVGQLILLLEYLSLNLPATRPRCWSGRSTGGGCGWSA